MSHSIYMKETTADVELRIQRAKEAKEELIPLKRWAIVVMLVTAASLSFYLMAFAEHYQLAKGIAWLVCSIEAVTFLLAAVMWRLTRRDIIRKDREITLLYLKLNKMRAGEDNVVGIGKDLLSRTRFFPVTNNNNNNNMVILTEV